MRILVHDLNKEKHTFVSRLSVNVASMDWGVISISPIPGAEHKALQKCSFLGSLKVNVVHERGIADTPAKVILVRVKAM